MFTAARYSSNSRHTQNRPTLSTPATKCSHSTAPGDWMPTSRVTTTVQPSPRPSNPPPRRPPSHLLLPLLRVLDHRALQKNGIVVDDFPGSLAAPLTDAFAARTTRRSAFLALVASFANVACRGTFPPNHPVTSHNAR